MKKLVALVLALVMMASFASFAAAEEGYNMPAMNTTPSGIERSIRNAISSAYQNGHLGEKMLTFEETASALPDDEEDLIIDQIIKNAQ